MPIVFQLPSQFLELGLVAGFSSCLLQQLLKPHFHLIPECQAPPFPDPWLADIMQRSVDVLQSDSSSRGWFIQLLQNISLNSLIHRAHLLGHWVSVLL